MNICMLYLTCADDKEAEKIARVLLEKKLVVCAKRFPVASSFLWKGEIDYANEVMLVMDSIEENFEKIKKEVAKIHSYETFVLVSLPVSIATDEVKEWVTREL
jgi:periplasmic divalent cation tolerance protein